MPLLLAARAKIRSKRSDPKRQEMVGRCTGINQARHLMCTLGTVRHMELGEIIQL